MLCAPILLMLAVGSLPPAPLTAGAVMCAEGTCDLEEPSSPTGGAAAMEPGAGAPSHMCEGFYCADASPPLRDAARGQDHDARVALWFVGFGVWLVGAPLGDESDTVAGRLVNGRLERPPRGESFRRCRS